MKRNDFIRNFTIGSTLFFVSPIVFQSCSKSDDLPNPDGLIIDLTSQEFSTLLNVGGYTYKSGVIIIRSGESQYMAFSSRCTHEGCTVTYSHASGNLPCPCHGSVFSNSGSVLQGPATAALKKYSVTINGNTLTIK